jgi:hypothetical protein
MKIIPIGLQCTVPEAIRDCNLREHSYPFDWLWTPSLTVYNIIKLLCDSGVDKTVEYMTTGFTYYTYLGNEHFISVNHCTECQMNKITGLGINHFTINDEYKETLKRRLQRLLNDINSKEDILFIYADAANPEANYHLDDINYGLPATEDLNKLYDYIYPLNNNVKILYFCWESHLVASNKISHVSFSHQSWWKPYLLDIVKNYLLTNYT